MADISIELVVLYSIPYNILLCSVEFYRKIYTSIELFRFVCYGVLQDAIFMKHSYCMNCHSYGIQASYINGIIKNLYIIINLYNFNKSGVDGFTKSI